MSDLNVPIKAIRATITFSEELSIDGYKMPDGKYRIGLSSASKAIGYSEKWLRQALNRSEATAKALQDIGFKGNFLEVFRESNQGNSFSERTISLDDFKHLITYGVIKGKQKAIAFQSALTKIALTDFFRDAFGETQLNINEKRKLFYQAYAESLSFEDWLEMDREDVANLVLFGEE